VTPLDLGLLLIRLVVGLLVFGHGTRKLFGWFGGAGLRANAGVFESLGYRPGILAALAAGVCEAGAAVLFLLGLATPLAGAMLLGSMLNAAMVQRVNGLWFANRGAEYPLVLATIAAMLAFTGPGRFSLAEALDLRLHGWAWGVGALLAGALGAAAILAAKALSTRTAVKEPA
jgi:putative oxidoreductase